MQETVDLTTELQPVADALEGREDFVTRTIFALQRSEVITIQELLRHEP